MRASLLLILAAHAHALTTSSRRTFGLGAASAAASAAALAPARPAAAAAVREGSTKSGLRFRVDVEGSGDKPQRGQQVLLDFVLRTGVEGKNPVYCDGTKQTVPPRPQRFALGIGAQIAGFDEAVLDMKAGETRTVIVPPELGYGANGTEGFDDKIPKDATLFYTLELRSILPLVMTDERQKWIADHPNPWDK